MWGGQTPPRSTVCSSSQGLFTERLQTSNCSFTYIAVLWNNVLLRAVSPSSTSICLDLFHANEAHTQVKQARNSPNWYIRCIRKALRPPQICHTLYAAALRQNCLNSFFPSSIHTQHRIMTNWKQNLKKILLWHLKFSSGDFHVSWSSLRCFNTLIRVHLW